MKNHQPEADVIDEKKVDEDGIRGMITKYREVHPGESLKYFSEIVAEKYHTTVEHVQGLAKELLENSQQSVIDGTKKVKKYTGQNRDKIEDQMRFIFSDWKDKTEEEKNDLVAYYHGTGEVVKKWRIETGKKVMDKIGGSKDVLNKFTKFRKN